MISAVDVNIPGKEKLIKMVGTTSGYEKARSIQWRPSKIELIVAHDTGAVTIWKSQFGTVTCIFLL